MGHAEYLQRMRGNYQFRTFRLEPQWVPGTGDIDGFCHDEVVRQFHDPRVEHDGGKRVRYMRAAWDYALTQSGQAEPVIGVDAAEQRPPDMDDILRLGATIEPEMNSTIGFRTMNVYIGDSTGAPPRLLNELVTILVQRVHDVRPVPGNPGPHPRHYRAIWAWEDATPVEARNRVRRFVELAADIETADDWYLAFEAVHPFGDGNGRSGKILNNWLMGTLAEPVLVADYFGGGNP